MKLSIFSDEINREDPARALELAAQWGVEYVEVRTLPGGRFPRVSDRELEEFQGLIEENGLTVSAVSPGFFKCPIDDPAVEAGLVEGIARACQWAKRLGTDLVSSFAFRREERGDVPEAVFEKLDEMVKIVREEGCQLVLENEAVCWGDTGLEAAEIIRRYGAKDLGLCWDPGNSVNAGSTSAFPDEYEALKGLVQHVHMKNFDAEQRGWSIAENGVVDWRGQIQALHRDGYDGFVVVETHLAISPDAFEVVDPEFSDLESNTYKNMVFLRECLDGLR